MSEVFKVSDLARRLPEEVWSWFEPILPPVAWCGNGGPPVDNRTCPHGILYVLVSGVGVGLALLLGWDLVPAGFPCGKTLRGRLKRWLELDCFRLAWARLAAGYQRLAGVNWDKVLLDGAKHKAPKGGRPPAPAPWTAPSAAPRCT